MSALEQYQSDHEDGQQRHRFGEPLAVAPDAVEVRRNAGLMGFIGLAATAVAIAWGSRLVSGGSALEWVALGLMTLVAVGYLGALLDSRTPLLVADDKGVRVRMGRTWLGLPWGSLREVEVEPRSNLLRDGRIALQPWNPDRVLDELGRSGRQQSRWSRLLHGSPMALPVGLSTTVRGARGDELAGALEVLARGRTEIVEVVFGDDDQTDETLDRAEAEETEQVPPGPEADEVAGLRSRLLRVPFARKGDSDEEQTDDELTGDELTDEAPASPEESTDEQAAGTADSGTQAREHTRVVRTDSRERVVEGEVVESAETQAAESQAADEVVTVTERTEVAEVTEVDGEDSEQESRGSARARLARAIMRWPSKRDDAAEENGETVETEQTGASIETSIETSEDADASEDRVEPLPAAEPTRALRTVSRASVSLPLREAGTGDDERNDDERSDDDTAVRSTADDADEDQDADEPAQQGHHRFGLQSLLGGRVRPIATPGSAVEPLEMDDLGAEPAEDPVIGPELAAARTRLGITVDQLAERTRIRPHVIESIEVDDFVPCGGDFYARGHLRTLARVLGVDAAPLLRSYDERYANAPVNAKAVFEAELASGGGSIRGTRGGPNWSILVAVVMALILAWSVARLVMDGPADFKDVPALNGSGGPGGRTVLGEPIPLVLRASGGGTHVVVEDGSGKEVFSGDLAYGASRSLSVVPPIQVRSDDGSLEVAVGGEERGAIGTKGESASETYVER